jgi:hypothetical protein
LRWFTVVRGIHGVEKIWVYLWRIFLEIRMGIGNSLGVFDFSC